MTALAGGSVYPLAADAFLHGEIDATTATIVAQLAGAASVFDPTHDSSADIAAPIGTPSAVTVDHVAGGAVFIDPIVFPALTGATVTALVAYVVGGPLLCHITRRADAVPILIVPDGGPLTLTFDRLFKL